MKNEKMLFIACGVFGKELEKVVSRRYHDSKILFTNPFLDLDPRQLEATIKEMISAHTSFKKTILVFGGCTPNIDSFVDGKKIFRVRGGSCYEILLGEKFSYIMKEERGSYFLTPFLCLNFSVVVENLGLGDPTLRERFFRNYRQLLLIDTGLHDDLERKAQDISLLLGLPMKVVKTGLDELQKRLEEVV